MTEKNGNGNTISWKWLAIVLLSILLGIAGFVFSDEIGRNHRQDTDITVLQQQYKYIQQGIERLERAVGTYPDTTRRLR